jgi:hypothetical protein
MDVTSETSNIEHYLARAAELRAVADQMKNEDARRFLLDIARDYERMAAALRKREAGKQ